MATKSSKWILRIAVSIGIIFLLMLGGRAFLATDVSGTWNFYIDWANGDHGAPVFVLQQDGGTLRGTYSGGLGKFDVLGTLKRRIVTIDLQLTDEFKSQRPEISHVHFSGKLDWSGQSIEGIVTIPAGGGRFVAKRT